MPFSISLQPCTWCTFDCVFGFSQSYPGVSLRSVLVPMRSTSKRLAAVNSLNLFSPSSPSMQNISIECDMAFSDSVSSSLVIRYATMPMLSVGFHL